MTLKLNWRSDVGKSTYNVTVFFGRFWGMWRKPRREQSTTAPEAEQEHGAGQTSAPIVAPTSKTTPTKSKTTNFSILLLLLFLFLRFLFFLISSTSSFTSSCFVLFQFFSPTTTSTTTTTTTTTTPTSTCRRLKQKSPRKTQLDQEIPLSRISLVSGTLKKSH